MILGDILETIQTMIILFVMGLSFMLPHTRIETNVQLKLSDSQNKEKTKNRSIRTNKFKNSNCFLKKNININIYMNFVFVRNQK